MDQTTASAWGICDARHGDMVSGWAWRPAAPEEHVEVEQWVDGTLTAVTVADLFRGDLLEAEIGHGRYGWEMSLALDPLKRAPQVVELRIKGGDVLVNGRLDVTVGELAEASTGPISADVVDRLDTRLNGWFRREAKELAPGFAISDGDVVVDVGSGDGQMAGFCAQIAAETILIDSDPARLERALDRLGRMTVGRVEGRVADAARLPIADGTATRVICTEVLEHLDDPVAAMAELVRIGRPGALYLLSVPGAAAEHLQERLAPPAYFEKPNHIRIFEADDFTRLVEEAGLVIEGRSDFGFFWTMWWMFFWQTGREFGEQSHALLDAWSRTWWELLRTPDGVHLKKVLDGFLPKSTAVVARKPV